MKEYYLTKRFKLIYLGLELLPRILAVVLILGVWLYLLRNTVISQVICLVFLMLVPFLFGIVFVGFIIINQIRGEHLTISDTGIEYSYSWKRLEVKWPDIKKISKHWHHSWYLDCMIVDHSNVHTESTFPEMNFFARFGTTAIPLACFDENWRESELGQQIKQYAPHLFSFVEHE